MAQFYFINKDEKSLHLSRSKPTEQADIQRYVQTGRKRPRPSKKLGTRPKAAQESKPKPNTRQPYDMRCLWEATPSFIPITSALSKQDPFDAAVVKLDSTISGLLHYYVYYYHPSLWPNEMAVLKAGMYTFHQAVITILQNVIENEMMMHCLLSATSCRMRCIDRLPSEDVSGKEEYYISRALRLMSQQITSTELRRALTCIVFMLSADSYRNELAAARLHLLAAHRLLEPLGGLGAIDDEFLSGQLSMGDLFLASVHIQPCLFACFYDPGPANTLALTSAELSPYHPMALDFPSLTPLDTPISQLAEAYSIRERLQISCMTGTRGLQATRWITKRCMAIRHNLLGMSTTGADNALRIALIMWSLLSMNITGRSKTVKLMAPGLQSAILNTFVWPDANLQKWILLVGFQCAEESSTTATWFTGRLFDIYRPSLPTLTASGRSKDQGVRLTNELVHFQEGYLYDNAVQRSRTCNLAARILPLRS